MPRARGGRPLVAALALAGAALAGCQSQWYLQYETHDLVTTNVTVRTEPPGGRVSWNGVDLGPAPLRMPVEYHHTEQLWSRQSNVGARMREDGSLNPLSVPASLIHETEDRRRHVYGGNRFEVVASKAGHADAYREIVLEGEDEVEIVLALRPLDAAQR